MVRSINIEYIRHDKFFNIILNAFPTLRECFVNPNCIIFVHEIHEKHEQKQVFLTVYSAKINEILVVLVQKAFKKRFIRKIKNLT